MGRQVHQEPFHAGPTVTNQVIPRLITWDFRLKRADGPPKVTRVLRRWQGKRALGKA
jgi:hypothetical protein